MKYLIKEDDPVQMYQMFKYDKYEIPQPEIMLVKKHTSERISYALYCEAETVYLLTNVSVENDKVCGNGGYAKPLCTIAEMGDYSLKELDSDAYNWYMTHAR